MSAGVTVAIAFHDEAAHLAAAVRSILHQTHTDFELLLVDDGSHDRSVEVARTFLVDPRVRLLVDGHRRHLAARLNQCVAEARGERFVRMDADDVSHPARLALQLAHLEEQRLDAVGTWAAMIDADERPFGVLESDPAHVSGRSLLERGLFPHATMIARTGLLRAHPYDETLTRAEDRDLWCRIGLAARVGVVSDVLYVVRLLPHAPDFLANYLRGQSDLRRVLWRHGPALAGRLPTTRLLAASVLKAGAMIAVRAAGRTEALVHRRGRPPTPRELVRIREALQAP